MKQATLAERKGWQLSKQGNVSDKKALADAGMVVGKVSSSLQAHFEKVGKTMAKEWSQKAGSRGAAVLSAYN
jgi:TRAP-type C4-dicarboxylate transport system substrate-binding protein